MKLFTVFLMSTYICANIQPVQADFDWVEFGLDVASGYAARETDKYLEKNGPKIELHPIIAFILVSLCAMSILVMCITAPKRAAGIGAGIILSEILDSKND